MDSGPRSISPVPSTFTTSVSNTTFWACSTPFLTAKLATAQRTLVSPWFLDSRS